ncbi:MAG TPA: alkaline phosphatase PhoX [Ilumatobacteraceae bacterium]|nr:alkaline phosphatase PhoX [Ilumatobacteraceae bacterium]
MTQSRRDLIQRSALVGGGLVFAGNLTGLFTGAPAVAAGLGRADRPGRGHGVGDLVPDPFGLLDLPDRFQYTIVSEAGEPTTDGGVLPDRFDGTATFASGRSTFLVRNHEQSTGAAFPALAAAELTYDPAAHGGTSTVEIDRRGDKVDEYVSLAGTNNNCAGGPTPWGTWLTCEETEAKAGTSGMTKDHGFVFEVDPVHPERNVAPTPLPALGRFAHEATTTDPRTGIVYMTEDAGGPNGLVYRCLPNQPLRGHGSLRAGGLLQAMRCTDQGTFVPDLSAYSEPGTTLRVGWVDVPDPLATTVSTRTQLTEVTRSRKFEGAWWGNGSAFIVCSYARNSDGSVGQHDGQVWRHDPGRGTLTLEVNFGVNPDTASDNPDGPDNITVSPWGGVILAEDGEGVQHLLAVTPDGATLLLARNARDDGEFTGVTFSSDRRTLYANLQQPGITFAITGPFNKIRHGA